MDRRFLFLTLSFLASIGFVYFLLNSEYQRVISYSEKEIIGVDYLRSVKKVMQHLPEHRWLLRDHLSGNTGGENNIRRSQEQIDGDVEQLLETDRRYEQKIPTSVSLRSFAKDWRELKERALSMSRLESEQAHRDMTSRLRDLVTDIGDESKLVLDPDLGSYYLMDVALVKLPEMQDLISQVLAVSMRLTGSPAIADSERTRLAQLLGFMQSTLNKMEKSYTRAFSARGTRVFESKLKSSYQDFAGASEGFVNTLYSGVLPGADADPDGGISRESVQMLGVKLFGKSFELWDETADALEKLLKERLAAARQKSYLAAAITLLLGLLTIASAFILMQAMRERQKAVLENERLAQAVASASDGIVITDPNQPDNPIVYANTTFFKLTGYLPSEVLGRNCRFLQGPGTDPDSKRQIREAIQQRKALKVTLLNYRKSGQTFWNGLRISPVFAEDGKLKHFLGFQADVSERMRAEQQLIAERDYTSSIIEGTPAIVVGIGKDGRTNFLNPSGERTTGYRAEEIIGKNWWTTFYPDEEYAQVEKLFEAFKKGDVRDYEMVLTAKNGEKRTVSWTSMNRLGEKGKIVEIVGFGDDVTERKKLEVQLQQSQKMETVGTLAGGIAHDLNNQLTPLTGYLDLVIKDISPDDPKRDLLMEAEQAARRCAEVVSRLMNVSRPSNQKKTWLRLDSLLAETKRLLPKILPSTIETEIVCDPQIWYVQANDTELQTILMNMAVNSRDAMPNGGRLKIHASNAPLDMQRIRRGFKPGDYVMLTVADTGQGIAADVMAKIFEPFFTTKPKGQGTGLGLSMVFRIVKDHGGWIDVSSEPGKGTTFQIYLPASREAQRSASANGDTAQAMPHGNETVLFADDEETLRNLGRVFLERLGYQVILARDGEEAVDLYKQQHSRIAAVILDMTMPKLTGKQTLKKILEIDPRARVLLASGFTAEGTAKELIQEGASDFLAKPYTILPLAQTLRKVIDKRV